MTKQEMLDYGATALNRIVDVLFALPKGVGTLVSETNTKGMQLYGGSAFTVSLIANDAAEFDALSLGTAPFFDARNGRRLEWVDGAWVPTPYRGTLPILRYNSLIMGSNNNRVYWFTAGAVFVEIDVTNPIP